VKQTKKPELAPADTFPFIGNDDITGRRALELLWT
jgi:hypothetical protein